MEKITMSVKELKIFRLGMEVIDGKLSLIDFSIQINKSYRQSQRIIKKLKDKGPIGAKHGNTGRTPHNKTSVEMEADLVDLLKNKYKNFNLTHFREKIEILEDIKIKKDALHSIAKKHNLVKHPKRRGRRCHKPRPRLAKEGMMIQFDGSNHVWFGEERTDLIGGIDA